MKATILDRKGNPVEITLDATLYREAHDNNCSVSQLLERKFDTDSSKYGSVLEQVAADSGLVLRAEDKFGLRAPRIAHILSGSAEMQAGVITREANPTSRLIFPAVLLEMMEDSLARDYDMDHNAFEKMIAITDTIAGTRYEQPVLNYDRPEGARHKGIAQGALPDIMMLLTVSERSGKIPTFSLGLEITDEAAKALTVDFVTMSLKRQAAVERAERAIVNLQSMINGDDDVGQAALSAVTSASLDSASTGGVLTHKAWVKFLYRSSRIRKVDFVICTLNTALKIENRSGKPTINTDDPNSPRIDSIAKIANSTIPTNVQMYIVQDGDLPDDVIIALDSKWAIRRIRNSEAQYQAAEQFVLKKTSAIRFDFGEICYRLYDEAWDKLTISA